MKLVILSSISLVAQLLFRGPTPAQTINTIIMKAIEEKAIKALGKGENRGNYAEFKTLLQADFDVLYDPMMGLFYGMEAKAKMEGIIADREKLPNKLIFSQEVITTGDAYALIAFDLPRSVMRGKYPYQGCHVIGFKITDGKSQVFGSISALLTRVSLINQSSYLKF